MDKREALIELLCGKKVEVEGIVFHMDLDEEQIYGEGSPYRIPAMPPEGYEIYDPEKKMKRMMCEIQNVIAKYMRP